MVSGGEFLPLEQIIFLFCKEWQQLERDLLTLEVPVAVYFAYEDKELAEIYEDIKTAINTDQAGSAFEGTKSSCTNDCVIITVCAIINT